VWRSCCVWAACETKVQLCKYHFWKYGRGCREGSACFFAHSLKELQPQPSDWPSCHSDWPKGPNITPLFRTALLCEQEPRPDWVETWRAWWPHIDPLKQQNQRRRWQARNQDHPCGSAWWDEKAQEMDEGTAAEMDEGHTQAEEHPKEAPQAKGETPVEGKPGGGRPVKTTSPDCAIGKGGIPGPEQSQSGSKDASPKERSPNQPMAGSSVPAKQKLPTPTSAAEPEAQQSEAPQSPANEAVFEVGKELARNPICWAQFVGPMMMSFAAAVTSAAVAAANPEDQDLALMAANSITAANNSWQRFKEACQPPSVQPKARQQPPQAKPEEQQGQQPPQAKPEEQPGQQLPQAEPKAQQSQQLPQTEPKTQPAPPEMTEAEQAQQPPPDVQPVAKPWTPEVPVVQQQQQPQVKREAQMAQPKAGNQVHANKAEQQPPEAQEKEMEKGTGERHSNVETGASATASGPPQNPQTAPGPQSPPPVFGGQPTSSPPPPSSTSQGPPQPTSENQDIHKEPVTPKPPPHMYKSRRRFASVPPPKPPPPYGGLPPPAEPDPENELPGPTGADKQVPRREPQQYGGPAFVSREQPFAKQPPPGGAPASNHHMPPPGPGVNAGPPKASRASSSSAAPRQPTTFGEAWKDWMQRSKTWHALQAHAAGAPASQPNIVTETSRARNMLNQRAPPVMPNPHNYPPRSVGYCPCNRCLNHGWPLQVYLDDGMMPPDLKAGSLVEGLPDMGNVWTRCNNCGEVARWATLQCPNRVWLEMPERWWWCPRCAHMAVSYSFPPMG
jgi:hypothetical protein